ncbi:MAG: hypothetical protein KAS23_13175, partial [Anaerohalosphaera sp.]|nr:hypothetical protein [Anaerohalosphaera sp.]
MKRFALFTRLFIILSSLSISYSHGNTITVNLNARSGGTVTVNLEPGIYEIKAVSGNYTAWNPWGTVQSPKPDGTAWVGWVTTTYMRRGTSGWTTIIMDSTPKGSVWATAQLALEHSRVETVEVSNPETFQFRISDSAYWDNTGGMSLEVALISPFIITSPVSKDLVLSGQNFDITWNTFGSEVIDNVALEYSDDDKITWNLIEASIANSSLYSWAVSGGVASDQCNIRISDATNPDTYRISDTFIIYTSNLKNSLQLNKQEFGHINGDIGFELWSFAGVARQQVRLQNLKSSGTAISYDLIGLDGWEGFVGLIDESELITLPASGNYTLIARSHAVDKDIVYSFVLKETTQTELPFDEIYDGTFTGSGQAELFHIVVDDVHSMHIKLDDTANNNYNEIYLKHGLPPTRGDYDYRYSTLASPDQDILILSAEPGDWYLLVYGDTINSQGNYSLIAEKKPIVLSNISPKIHGDIIDTVFTLKGAGFEHLTQVNLVSGEVSYPSDSIKIVGDGQAHATFVAKSIPAGIYSVEVVHDEGRTDRLDDVFEMIEGGLAELETKLILPSRLGYHHLATLYVEYSNTGYASMPAPILVVNASQHGSEGALLTLDKSILSRGFWTSTMPEAFDTSVQILASGDTPGVLHPGETKKTPIYYTGWLKPWNFSYPRINFELSVLDTDNNFEIDWR